MTATRTQCADTVRTQEADMATRITDKLVKELTPPEKGNRVEYDTEVAGFGLRITAAGARSFVLNYRNAEGRERRLTIGPYGQNAWSVQAARRRAGVPHLRACLHLPRREDPADLGPARQWSVDCRGRRHRHRPAPPPAGLSSTLRCLSRAKSRKLRVFKSHKPFCKAAPVTLVPSGPGKRSGKSVRQTARHGVVINISLKSR